MKLTPAQRDALALLAAHPTEWLEGWKQRTGTHGRPRVNMRAAGSLVRLKLARSTLPDPRFWSPYTHDSKYQITEEGKRRHAE